MKLMLRQCYPNLPHQRGIEWSFIHLYHYNLDNIPPIGRILPLWRISPDWEISLLTNDSVSSSFSQLGENLPIGRISPFLDISPSWLDVKLHFAPICFSVAVNIQ